MSLSSSGVLGNPLLMEEVSSEWAVHTPGGLYRVGRVADEVPALLLPSDASHLQTSLPLL